MRNIYNTLYTTDYDMLHDLRLKEIEVLYYDYDTLTAVDKENEKEITYRLIRANNTILIV